MKMTELGKNKVLMAFDDILDLAEYAEAGPADGYSREDTPRLIKFSGGTWSDALEQARTGNPKLVKSFFEGVNVLNAVIEQEKVGEIRDVAGEYFDVADFLSGEPEVFRREEWGDRRQVVSVYANTGMNCVTKNNVIENRGCGIIALCDELSRSGFIVDLHLVEADDYDKMYYTEVKVRLDPLDLDTAAFIVANPMFHRRLWLAVLEHVTGKKYCGGYGRPREFDLEDIFSDGVSGFYFTSSNHGRFAESNYWTLEATKTHILKMIDEFKNNAAQVILG